MEKVSNTQQSADGGDVFQQVLYILYDAWRFRWLVVVVAWVVAIAGWIFVAAIPYKYEASTQVYVDTDSLLTPLLKGIAVETKIEDKLGIMTQTLLSRPNMEKVIRVTDMDHSANNQLQLEGVINGLRSAIEVTSSKKQNLYTIMYAHTNPETAKAVVQSLLTIFVENTLGGSREDSDIAKNFLDKQIAEYEAKLVEAEKSLMEYKRKHLGLLPGQGIDYFGRLQSAQADLEQANFELKQAQHQKRALEKQAAELVDATTKNTSINNQLTQSIDGRIRTLETRLDGLLLRYTAEHPDVEEIEQTIVALKQQRQEQLESLSQSDNAKELLASNPVYQEMNLALGQASANIAAAEVRVNEFERRVKNLQEQVGIIPKIEAELASLNRDYNINKEQYDTLITRRESARMSKEAETAGDNVKFQIIEPPYVPSTPSKPNKLLLNSAVLGIAVLAGLGLAYLWGQIRQVVYDVRSLRSFVAIPVYGAVSLLEMEGDKLLHQKQVWHVAVGGIMLLIMYGIVLGLNLIL